MQPSLFQLSNAVSETPNGKYIAWLFVERETERIDVQFDVDKIKNVDKPTFG